MPVIVLCLLTSNKNHHFCLLVSNKSIDWQKTLCTGSLHVVFIEAYGDCN